jgi:predicted RNA binding protein YcfA (HicA-like mRNA interferase family)
MSDLPSVTAREMIAALQRAGFLIIRSKGGHQLLRHPQDPIRTTTVSMHPGDLPPGTVRAILKQARLSRQEFLDLLY